jgi:hypothetical protein
VVVAFADIGPAAALDVLRLALPVGVLALAVDRLVIGRGTRRLIAGSVQRSGLPRVAVIATHNRI